VAVSACLWAVALCRQFALVCCGRETRGVRFGGGRALKRGEVVVGEHSWGCNPGQWGGEDLRGGDLWW
jgi:hypothetical protein